jgi:mevalonate kinase
MLSSPTFNDEFFGTTLLLPGKTFLLGEYGALVGEPALLCATTPQFRARAIKEQKLVGIHPDSPAGQLWRKNANSFGVEFDDPYHGVGGFGASGAQYLAVYALAQFRQTGERMALESWSALLESYFESLGPKEGELHPSGADLVSQLAGGICYFDRRRKDVHVHTWPFADLDFALLKTPGKVPTHEHVSVLTSHQVRSLGAAAQMGEEALRERDSEKFVQSVKVMADALQERGFVAETTRELLEKWRQEGVLAAKGCGALGADVLAVFFRPDHRQGILRRGETLGLQFVAGSSDMSPGLQWELTLRS